MALSLGKPVIFHCEDEQKTHFYREVHPLCRLIEFNTGVVVGAMITNEIDIIRELLWRLFENKMQYRLEEHPTRRRYLRLKEQLTNSVVRLQTDDQMLSETFWNHYHNPYSVGGIADNDDSGDMPGLPIDSDPWPLNVKNWLLGHTTNG